MHTVFMDRLHELLEGFAGDPPGLDTDQASYDDAVEWLSDRVEKVERVSSPDALLVTLTDGSRLRVVIDKAAQ